MSCCSDLLHTWTEARIQQTNRCCLENKQTKINFADLNLSVHEKDIFHNYLELSFLPFHWNVQSLCTRDVKYYWLCPMRLFCKILNLPYILYTCTGIYIYFMQMLKICKTVNLVNKRQIERISVGFHWSSFSLSSLMPLHFSDLLHDASWKQSFIFLLLKQTNITLKHVFKYRLRKWQLQPNYARHFLLLCI